MTWKKNPTLLVTSLSLYYVTTFEIQLTATGTFMADREDPRIFKRELVRNSEDQILQQPEFSGQENL